MSCQRRRSASAEPLESSGHVPLEHGDGELSEDLNYGVGKALEGRLFAVLGPVHEAHAERMRELEGARRARRERREDGRCIVGGKILAPGAARAARHRPGVDPVVFERLLQIPPEGGICAGEGCGERAADFVEPVESFRAPKRACPSTDPRICVTCRRLSPSMRALSVIVSLASSSLSPSAFIMASCAAGVMRSASSAAVMKSRPEACAREASSPEPR